LSYCFATGAKKGPGVFVPDLIRKCVAFVGVEYDDGRFAPKATGFFTLAGEGNIQRSYLLTARHVVANVKKFIQREKLETGVKAWLAVRLNLKAGGSQTVSLDDAIWWLHPDFCNSTDVAATPCSFQQPYFDHFPIPLYGSVVENSTTDHLKRRGASLGQEIAIIGLFRNHRGRERNEPIVRVGNIAAMPDDQVLTDYGYTDGYLVEARSIGGLSGSPVFVNLWDGPNITLNIGVPRVEGTVDFKQYMLFGLMHGHWDLPNLTDDAVVEDGNDKRESINSGIGVVIPVQKILETLYRPELVAMRKEIEDRERDAGCSD
jgi:hypothetical protein